jgi:DNA primase
MDPLIVQVIHRYHPEWDAPPDNGYDWISTLCPFHQESNRSASVSYDRNAFHCFACPTKGDAIALIRLNEEVTFEEAFRIAEELAPGSHRKVPRKSARKSGRRVFAEQGVSVPENPGGPGQVPVGIRQRPSAWT